MKQVATLFAFICFSIVNGFTQTSDTWQEKDQSLDSILQSQLIHKGKKPVHNFMLYAKNQKTEEVFYQGAGILGRNDSLIEKDDQFKIDSITKTFVATVVLQLVEERKLQLDGKVYPYLSDIDYIRFDDIHILDGTRYAREITIEQLLRHNSGIADIWADKLPRFVLRVLLKKDRSYTLEDVMDLFYKYKLHKHPANKPGEGYHYSDMNYMLLGFTIEQVTGKSLVENIRERILEPLNMQDTYFEYYEAERGKKKQVDTYLNKLTVTQKVNTSYEWAGGGLVATTKDLGTFIEALFQHQLFRKEATLDTMLDLTYNESFDKKAGMGIFQYEIDHSKYYGHGGFYGSLMLYSPEDEVVLVVNIGQANAELDPYQLMDHIAQTVK